MSKYVYVGGANSTSSSNTIIYYETSTTGVFDGVLSPSGTSSNRLDSNLDTFRVASVPTGSSNSYRKVYWSSTTGSAYTTNTDFGLLTVKANSLTKCAFTATSVSSNRKLIVSDAHGTHNGSYAFDTLGTYYTDKQVVGAKHLSTESGYVYGGVRVVCNRSDLLSSGYTEQEGAFIFPADYEGAIVIRLASGDATIEFIYDVEPYSKTITLDPNGGSLPSGQSSTVLCMRDYSAALAVTPTRDGYSTTGWWDSTTGGNRITAETVLDESSPNTIYAQWAETPTPTPTERTGHIVRSSSTDFLAYSASGGSLVYAR